MSKSNPINLAQVDTLATAIVVPRRVRVFVGGDPLRGFERTAVFARLGPRSRGVRWATTFSDGERRAMDEARRVDEVAAAAVRDPVGGTGRRFLGPRELSGFRLVVQLKVQHHRRHA